MTMCSDLVPWGRPEAHPRGGYGCCRRTSVFPSGTMINLSKILNYYITCGYIDLRLGPDGLAAVVTQQYGNHLGE